MVSQFYIESREHELRASEEKYRTTIDHAPDPMYEIEPYTWIVRGANAAADAMYRIVKDHDDKPLVVLNQIEPVLVSFSVPESSLSQIRQHARPGQKLAVAASVAGNAASPQTGELTFIDNTVDPTTGALLTLENIGDVTYRGGEFRYEQPMAHGLMLLGSYGINVAYQVGTLARVQSLGAERRARSAIPGDRAAQSSARVGARCAARHRLRRVRIVRKREQRAESSGVFPGRRGRLDSLAHEYLRDGPVVGATVAVIKGRDTLYLAAVGFVTVVAVVTASLVALRSAARPAVAVLRDA